MAMFISLLRLTQKGAENVSKGPERVAAAKRAFKAMGVEVKAFFLVMGHYDAVIIADAPNDETIAKAILSLTALGYVRAETLRAFSEEEYRSIIAAAQATSYATA